MKKAHKKEMVRVSRLSPLSCKLRQAVDFARALRLLEGLAPSEGWWEGGEAEEVITVVLREEAIMSVNRYLTRFDGSSQPPGR